MVKSSHADLDSVTLAMTGSTISIIVRFNKRRVCKYPAVPYNISSSGSFVSSKQCAAENKIFYLTNVHKLFPETTFVCFSSGLLLGICSKSLIALRISIVKIPILPAIRKDAHAFSNFPPWSFLRICLFNRRLLSKFYFTSYYNSISS